MLRINMQNRRLSSTRTSPRFRTVQVPYGEEMSEFYQVGGDAYFRIEQAFR